MLSCVTVVLQAEMPKWSASSRCRCEFGVDMADYSWCEWETPQCHCHCQHSSCWCW